MLVCAAAAGAELAADVAGELEELLPELLPAAMSVTASVAAIADITVAVAREGPTPGHLRNLMGTSWWRAPGPWRAPMRATEGVPGVPCARKIDRMYGCCQCPVEGQSTADTKQIRACHPISWSARARPDAEACHPAVHGQGGTCGGAGQRAG